MEAKEIIEKWAKEKTIETIVQNIAGTHDEDLLDLVEDLYVSLLEKPASLIEKLYEEDSHRFYITKMALHNIYSVNSPYYYKYKRFKNLSEEYDKDDCTTD